MIRDYFVAAGGRNRPFVSAILEFPSLGRRLPLPLLVDTARRPDHAGPARRAARRHGLAALLPGVPSSGIGGRVPTRTVDAILTIQGFSSPLSLAVLEWLPPPAPLPTIYSVLGRDVISRFGLFVEERTSRILLMTPDEANALRLP